ncbi:Hypothetical predicted protein [Paramuricea clavata]|uniref:Uncharacterized protein n=1 Tax=Paramuricea clavata TaxID=317549 RepID=A0A7D9J5W4_PARCT|nr:Hypothetical predicted protein [Paramuricea clavata]
MAGASPPKRGRPKKDEAVVRIRLTKHIYLDEGLRIQTPSSVHHSHVPCSSTPAYKYSWRVYFSYFDLYMKSKVWRLWASVQWRTCHSPVILNLENILATLPVPRQVLPAQNQIPIQVRTVPILMKVSQKQQNLEFSSNDEDD